MASKGVAMKNPLISDAGGDMLSEERGLSLFWTQLRVICRKNLSLAKRDRKTLAREILIPIFFMLGLAQVKLAIKDEQVPAMTPSAVNLASGIDPDSSLVTDPVVAVTTERSGSKRCIIPGCIPQTADRCNLTYSLEAQLKKHFPHNNKTFKCFDNSMKLREYAQDETNLQMAFGVALSSPWHIEAEGSPCTAAPKGADGNRPLEQRPADVTNASCTIPYTLYTNYSNFGMKDFNWTRSLALWQSNQFDNPNASGFDFLQTQVDAVLMNASMKDGRPPPEVTVTAAWQYIPSFFNNPSYAALQQIFPIYLTIIFSIQVRVLLVRILEEKEKKLKEGMLMVGLLPSVNMLGHIVAQLVKGLVPIAFVLIVSFSAQLFQYSDWSLLLVYFLVFALDCFAFCFVISSFFSTAKTGGIAGYLIYTVLLFLGELSSVVSATGCTLLSTIAPAGFFIGNAIVNAAEANNFGVTWANMGDKTITQDSSGTSVPISFATVLGMLVFDFFFYMALNFYLERVVRTEFGTTLPWHFPCHLSWWRDGTIGSEADDGIAMQRPSRSASTSEAVIEEVEEDDVGPMAVSITSLCKRFKAKADGAPAADDGEDDGEDEGEDERTAGGRSCCGPKKKNQGGDTKWLKAVDNLSLDMYEGQITALLGHNGAGKSTTISMLTGLYPPTSGTATLYDQDLTTQMEKVRQLIGVCPQHDVIWPLLTVEEHLHIFAAIKGVKPGAVGPEATRLIEDVALQDKRHERAGSLSGGMKRRLSCAMALIGNPKVVFLDEPTSGLDPQARRQIWALLEKEREGRVTVLTTHFMDEADLLGDRVAILSAGKLRCVGSSLFLKNRFGVGYHLTLAKKVSGRGGAVQSNSGATIAAVRRFVPSAELQTEVAGEITMLLPLDQVGSFPALLDHIEANLGPLGLSSYAMSVSTLEEVFLKIAEIDHEVEAKRLITAKGEDGDGGDGDGGDGGGFEAARADDQLLGRSSRSGSSLNVTVADDPGLGDKDDFGRGCTRAPFGRQLRALLVKRVINARRDKKMQVYQFLYPVLGVFIANLIASPLLNLKNTPTTTITPLTPAQFLGGDDSVLVGLTVNSAGEGGSTFADFGDYLGSVNGASWNSTKTEYVTPYNKSIQSGDELANWTLNQQIAYDKTGNGPISLGSVFWKSADVTSNNYSYEMRYNVAKPGAAGLMLAQLDGAVLNKARGGSPKSAAGFAVFSAPLPSRETPLDIGPLLFSIVMSIYFPFFITTIGAIAGTNIVMEQEKGVKRQQLVGGARLSAFWAANFAFDCSIFFMTWVCFVVIVQLLQVKGWVGANTGVVALLFLLFGPAISAWSYVFTFRFKKATSYTTAVLVGQSLFGMALFGANMVFYQVDSLSGAPQDWLQYVGMLLLPSYPLSWGLFIVGYNAGICESSNGAAVKYCDAAPLAWENAGKPVVFLVVSTVLYLLITLTTEWRRWQFATGAVAATAAVPASVQDEDEDPDVAEERRRVGHAGASQAAGEAHGLNPAFESADNIQVRGLTKVFPGSTLGRPAVSNITLGIPMGECFGLLGPNGAGKTTTLGMLSGDVRPTSGTASLHGLDVGTQLPEIFGSVGYCPQFDALPELMTGREVLTMFAEVKGVPPARVAPVVDALLEKMTLTRHANKSTKTYSGGNKRKLSLAVAMMGDPKIIFLDEPSTGMDPQARRAMWDVISSSVQGRSIILTTHLMEECEALCQRIGIVVKGRLACLGSAQHLKQRFGEGYSVEVKTANLDKVAQVQEFITSLAANAVLGEHHGGHLHYQLPKAGISLAAVFRKFESNKTRLEITEYAVAQTSLEQVFLRFAKEQDMELETIASQPRKFSSLPDVFASK